ncbi:hypothetical protein BGZ93_002349, partial [Podila epicladia]
MAYAPSRRRGNSILPPRDPSILPPADMVPGPSSLSSRGGTSQHYQLKHDYSDLGSAAYSSNSKSPFTNTHTHASSPSSSRPQSQLAPPRVGRMRSGSGAVSPGLSPAFGYGVSNTTNTNSSHLDPGDKEKRRRCILIHISTLADTYANHINDNKDQGIDKFLF